MESLIDSHVFNCTYSLFKDQEVPSTSEEIYPVVSESIVSGQN